MSRAAIDGILAGLLAHYRERASDLESIVSSLLADGMIANRGRLVTDHLAFRTFGIAPFDIASLERIFVHHGYRRRDAYAFPDKHLDALWYSPPIAELPRLFVSQLRVDELHDSAQQVVRSAIAAASDPFAAVDPDAAGAVVAALCTRPWPLPSFADYRLLLPQSEYAAWTLANGYAINHVALSVHELRADVASAAGLNDYLARRGFSLNGSGRSIQISADGLLRQSSTLAQTVVVRFADGRAEPVAGSYVEFVERRALPPFASLPSTALRREHRRDGFEAANAERIFDSTDLRQAK